MCAVAHDESARFQPADVRRRQILDATAMLAIERGLDDVSIAQVATAARIAKGSIYLHFGSRNELIDALRADLWHDMLDEPTRLIADGSFSWTERLDRVVEHLVRFSLENEELYHAVFHATTSHSDEPWTESRALLQTLLAGGRSAAEFDLVDVDITTDFLLHAYAGPCYHSDDEHLISTRLKQLFRRAVGATPDVG